MASNPPKKKQSKPSQILGMFIPGKGPEEDSTEKPTDVTTEPFVVFSNPSDSVVDIIFVHGIHGSQTETWKVKGASESWPKAFLGEKIPNARILAYGYNTPNKVSLSDIMSQEAVHKYARTLLTNVDDYRQNTKSEGRKTIFVAHDFGGLLCEEALIVAEQESQFHSIRNGTIGILYLGTPQRRRGLVEWAQMSTISKHSKMPGRKAGLSKNDIATKHKDDLDGFEKTQSQFERLSIRQACCFEERSDSAGRRLSPEWATLPDSRAIGIASDHFGMTKFLDKEDPGYVRVAAELSRWVKETTSSS